MTYSSYPRNLSQIEKEILTWLVPEIIPGYKPYNDFLQSSRIIGEGRWGEGDLIFDKKNSSIDRTLGMPPVIAYGECRIDNTSLAISIHDFNIDDQLEAQFSGIFPLPESVELQNKWCYSYWKSGAPCPATGAQVKEIRIQNRYILVVSPKKKVLWLHHLSSGFNQLLPVTGFYDELLRTKNIRDASLISHPQTFFDRIDDFSDTQYTKALLEYNKKASRKFDVSGIVIEVPMKKKSLFQRLFGK